MKKEITITKVDLIEAIAKAVSSIDTGIGCFDKIVKEVGGKITTKLCVELFGEPNIRDAYEIAEESLKRVGDNKITSMLAEAQLETIKEKALKEGYAKEVKGKLVWNESKLNDTKKKSSK